MTRARALPNIVGILAVVLGAAAIACVLPENPYQRWQLLGGTIHARTRWIYERCHFDPTPIDVVFVGPSRTSQGVNAPRLARELAARGLPSNVVNFSLPESGRNINYAIIRQMYERKRPRLIVLGVTEKPSRLGHSAFKYVAPRSLIVDPGYFGDVDYPGDLIYLPFRQMKLFLADLDPGLMGLRKTFDPSDYAGPSIDTTGDVRLPDGTIKNGTLPASAAELRRGVKKLEAGTHPPVLPRRLADVEFGDERHYVRAIVALARAHGARVVFLALPYYTGPSTLQEAAFYRRYGPIWNAGAFSTHAELYSDYGHLIRRGAARVTDWLAPKVAAMLAASPGGPPLAGRRRDDRRAKVAAAMGAPIGKHGT
ncbi:MAG: hypothetical protein ACYC8V_01860 [Caulobacteraceae bacterium]